MSPQESESASTLLWTFLGLGYSILLAGVSMSVGYLLGRAVHELFVLVPAGFFLGPILGVLITAEQMDPEKRNERKGLRIGLALFFGLCLLLPVVICGGMLLAH